MTNMCFSFRFVYEEPYSPECLPIRRVSLLSSFRISGMVSTATEGIIWYHGYFRDLSEDVRNRYVFAKNHGNGKTKNGMNVCVYQKNEKLTFTFNEKMAQQRCILIADIVLVCVEMELMIAEHWRLRTQESHCLKQKLPWLLPSLPKVPT